MVALFERVGTNRRGQVTIFIILGLLLLAAAGFLFFIVSAVQTEDLVTAQEDVVSSIFQKEGLSLFTQDCLEDSLEEGLVLIGQQGRIWQGQSGSSLGFVEGDNGILYGSDARQLYLGVQYFEDEGYVHRYPCIGEDEAPDFCQYVDGDRGAFGSKGQISLTTVESDLERFMLEEARSCAEEFLNSEIGYTGDIVVGDLSLSVSLEVEGFDVSVSYPFELVIGGESYFHLENFDFFYISDFYNFFQKGVSTPLNSESLRIDYDLSSDTILGSSSLLRSLPLSIFVEEVESGNHVLSYFLDAGTVLSTLPYSFFVGVENRPPALDYISRRQCDAYDYLTIKGFENDMGSISLLPFAKDADGDDVSYSSYVDDPVLSVLFDPIGEENEGLAVGYQSLIDSDIAAGEYDVFFQVEDEHGLKDAQDVRLLIDNEMQVSVQIENPYGYDDQSGKTIVSLEDPTFVSVAIGESSVASEATEAVSLSYTDGLGIEEWSGFSFDISSSRENCFGFPFVLSSIGCSLDSYESYIENFLEEKNRRISADASFSSLTSFGEMRLDFTRSYCAQFEDPASDFAQLKVQECIPHENATNPYSFPYHVHNYDADGNYLGEERESDINPFLAGHSCCNVDGTFKDEGEVCFESEPGCFGRISDYTVGLGGYVVEEAYDICTGERGNVCGDGQGAEYRLYTVTSSDFPMLLCGSDSYSSCNLDRIPDACEGKPAWGFVEDPDSNGNLWCHGTMGCSQTSSPSDGAIVYVSFGSPPSSFQTTAMEVLATGDRGTPGFDFVVGCENTPAPSTAAGDFECDANYDGVFEGICENGVCS